MKNTILFLFIIISIASAITHSLIIANTKYFKPSPSPLIPSSPHNDVVDTRIIQSPGQSDYQNTTNHFETYFKENPLRTDAIIFKNNLSEISFFTLEKQQFGNLTHSLPLVKDNTITYPQIYPDLDLKYTLSPSRLLEEFVITNRQDDYSLVQITQEVNLTNVDYYEEVGGGIKFYYQHSLVFSLPKPVLYELDNKQQTSYGIKYEIKKLNDNNLLISKVITTEGLTWIKSTDRVYPLIIDLVIDNADTASNWVSSDSTILDVSQEGTIVQEGTGSVKLSAPSWYDYTWPYRIKLTIEADYVDADLTDFPVYLDLNDLPSSFHSNVNQTDARDIRITKGDGTTEIPREVVYYTAASDTGELHFNYSGTLSGSTDTSIYLYYGNSGASDYGATDTYGRNNVWDSNYIGVYHLHESSGTHYSSTGSHDSTSVAVTQQGANIGQLYTADEFASTNDISFADDNAYSINTTNQFSAEAWVKVDSLSARQEPLNKGTTSNYEWGLRIETSGSLRPTIYTSAGGDHMTCTASSQISTSTWYYLALTSNLSTPRTEVYNNGSSVCNDTTKSGSYTNGTAAMRIGERVDFANDTDGVIDEVRFSDIARSSNWILTQYNNQYSPGTFFNSFGSEETILGQTATRTVSATDLSSYDSLTYWVRSNRTGSFMRFQFGESTSSEQTNSITISSANTWEQKTWNISGISGTARNAVTKYAFYITDASVDFDFYFDDVQASTSNSSPTTPSLDTPTDTATNQSLTPALLTTTTDTDSDYLRYKIELCENVGMTTNCQTFDQTSSQTGWSGQNTQSNTAYSSGTQASYTIQSSLTANLTYHWRSYALDPGGSNSWSSTQGTPYSFTTQNDANGTFYINSINLNGIIFN